MFRGGKCRLFAIPFYQLNPHRPMYVAEGFTEPNLAGWGITQRQRGTGMTDGLERRKFIQSVGLLAGSTASVAAT